MPLVVVLMAPGRASRKGAAGCWGMVGAITRLPAGGAGGIAAGGLGFSPIAAGGPLPCSEDTAARIARLAAGVAPETHAPSCYAPRHGPRPHRSSPPSSSRARRTWARTSIGRRALVAEAAQRGAELVLLPENFAFLGGGEEERRAIAEDLDLHGLAAAPGPIARRPRRARAGPRHLAARRGACRSGRATATGPTTPAPSSPPTAASRRATARSTSSTSTSPSAPTASRRASSPGREPVTVEAAGLRVGLSICYDLRFPELYRALSTAGAEVLVVPAAFTVPTGKDHWHVLLRARAIEAQAYVIAAAQWGKHPGGRMTYGKSCIVDPWGEVIAQASEGEGVITAAVDRGYLARVRASLPVAPASPAGLTRRERAIAPRAAARCRIPAR